VLVGDGAWKSLRARLPAIAPGRWFLVSSKKVFRLHGPRLLAGAGAALHRRPIFVPDGETAKTWQVLGRLLEELAARGLRRDGGIVALGGGTVGDVAGLAASLALRGVPLVQAPTTLLAAADSALGGKTAVDLPSGKNLAGSFHAPRLVAAEPAVLSTLKPRDLRSGLAEVAKCSFLDAGFDRAMESLAPRLLAAEPAALAESVFRSLRLKAAIVSKDPFETRGVRVFLNLGHTAGHALESASAHRLTHGEAVAWGLLTALELSVRRVGLSATAAARLSRRVLALVQPPVPGRHVLAGWRSRLFVDKKSDRSGLKAVLLRRPGRPVLARVGSGELAAALSAVFARYNGALRWL
jgi:3-dehydroquinate synthetase